MKKGAYWVSSAVRVGEKQVDEKTSGVVGMKGAIQLSLAI